MEVKFNACPDCGTLCYPSFERELPIYSDHGGIAVHPVFATCENCGWRTGFKKTVKGCAEEWNNKSFESEEY